MTKCKACGASARKTTTALVGIVGTRSGWRMGRVCRDCRRGGLLVVAQQTPPGVVVRQVKSDGIKSTLRQLRAIRDGWEKSPPPNLRGFMMAKSEGLEVAIQALERLGGES